MDSREPPNAEVVRLRRAGEPSEEDRQRLASTIFAEQDEVSTFSRGNLVPPGPSSPPAGETPPAADPFFEDLQDPQRRAEKPETPAAASKHDTTATFFERLGSQTPAEMSQDVAPPPTFRALPGSASLPRELPTAHRRRTGVSEDRSAQADQNDGVSGQPGDQYEPRKRGPTRAAFRALTTSSPSRRQDGARRAARHSQNQATVSRRHLRAGVASALLCFLIGAAVVVATIANLPGFGPHRARPADQPRRTAFSISNTSSPIALDVSRATAALGVDVETAARARVAAQTRASKRAKAHARRKAEAAARARAAKARRRREAAATGARSATTPPSTASTTTQSPAVTSSAPPASSSTGSTSSAPPHKSTSSSQQPAFGEHGSLGPGNSPDS
jgi:hypothetical protein